MCSGFAGSTSMSGSLFGNGPSQSRFVFAPPLGAVQSNVDDSPFLCLPFCLTNSATTVRLLPRMPRSPSSPAALAAAMIAANANAAANSSTALPTRIRASP